jgi:membrane protein implicated in regulation of membrane protease activity
MPDLMSLYVAHPFWAWIVLAGALLAVEVMTGSGWMLWPAGVAAVMAFLATYGHLDPGQALLVFALLTISSVLLARRYLPKSLLRRADNDINDNVGRLVGHQGRVVAAFNDRSGRVFVDGKEWAAEADDSEALKTGALKAGARVEVTGVTGARLKVRPV